MPNVFDQFDAAPASAPDTPSTGTPGSGAAANPFDQFDAPAAPSQPQGLLTNSPNDGWISGAAKGLGTAAVRGASMIAGTAGDLNNVLKLGEAAARQYRMGGNFADNLAATNAAEAQNDAALKSATGIDASNLPTWGQNKICSKSYAKDPWTLGRVTPRS